MPTQPDLKEMNFDGETFYRVGCRNCGGGDWLIFVNGRGKWIEGKYFVAYCFCGHKIEIAKAELKNKPDEQPISLRMVI